MVLVPVNMSRFGFSPCKKTNCFWSLQIFLFFTIVLEETIFKNKIFCRDQKLQNGSSHHVSSMQIITKIGSETILKNKNFCKDQKQFFFAGTKTKTRHICRD